MESSLRELAMYRMERAFEMLIAAEDNLKIGQYKTSLNRSYYAIFHAMRAANIIKGFDSSKHSGVIAFFNKEYLKENIIDRKMSPIIKNSSFFKGLTDDEILSILHCVEATAVSKGCRKPTEKCKDIFKCSRGLFKNGKSQPSGESSNLPALNGDSEFS